MSASLGSCHRWQALWRMEFSSAHAAFLHFRTPIPPSPHVCSSTPRDTAPYVRIYVRNAMPIALAGDFLVNLLATKGLSLEEFAIKGVVQVICRITKFGWFDAGDGMKQIVSSTSQFLQHTVRHCIIGLRILNDLVMEMNYKNKNRSMTQHRKVAVSFRDASLFQVFEISLSMLNQVATRSIDLSALRPDEASVVEDKIIDESLALVTACMNFDFLGSNPDEDGADATSVQVPATWRERLQSGSTLRVLFNLYKGCTTGRIPLIPDAAAGGSTAAAARPFGGSGGGFGSSADAEGGARPAGAIFGYKPFSGMAAAGSAAPTRDMRVSFARACQCEWRVARGMRLLARQRRQPTPVHRRFSSRALAQLLCRSVAHAHAHAPTHRQA